MPPHASRTDAWPIISEPRMMQDKLAVLAGTPIKQIMFRMIAWLGGQVYNRK
jgi:hypothetical protein